MKNATKEFCKRLNISFCDELVPFYEKGYEMFQVHGFEIVDIDRLKKLNIKYNIFRKWFDDILLAASKIKEDKDILLFNYILCAIIKEKGNFDILEVPDRKSIETDFAPMFAFLWFAENMADYMKKKELPFDVISDTLYCFDAEINDYYSLFGRSGMRIFVSWYMQFIRHEIIRVGRLNHEFMLFPQPVRVYKKGDDVKILVDGVYVHEKGMLLGSAGQKDKEDSFFAEITEKDGKITGFPANEYGECMGERITLEGYKEILRPGDEVISVHIPAAEPFTPELCKNSFEKTREIVKKCYPEKNIKAFYCFSWMVEKRLKDIIGKETNITKFADMFEGFPTKSPGTGVYGFLFNCAPDIPNVDLPENTSMQRAVKKHLCDGGFIYEKGGIVLF